MGCTIAQEGKLSVVFRKKGPTRFVPDWIYAYLTTPISAITVRAPVLSYQYLPLSQALSLAKQGGIAEDELQSYADQPFSPRYLELLVYSIGEIEVAKSPVTMQVLATKYGFWPSPSFIPLSTIGKATIDRLARFAQDPNKVHRHGAWGFECDTP